MKIKLDIRKVGIYIEGKGGKDHEEITGQGQRTLGICLLLQSFNRRIYYPFRKKGTSGKRPWFLSA